MKDFDYEQMLAGELYLAKFIQDENKSYHGQRLAQQINQVDIRNKEEIIRLEKQLFGSTGTYIYATPPVYVDFGRHVHIGENFYANTGCVFLDTTTITIGENVMLAPRVGLYTAGHPIDSDIRISDLEFALPITIKDNVWIGANAIVLPGVTIGKNSIIGAGAVVNKDIPENVIAAGNPAKIIREITKQDKEYWEKKKANYFEARKKIEEI